MRNLSQEINIINRINNMDCKVTILFSVDEKFLRIYGIEMMLICNALTDIHFHIHTIGDSENMIKLIEEMIDLYNNINNLRKSKNKYLTFSIEELPDDITDKTAFYTCSRYIHANYFMQQFNTDVYILDADTVFINTPYPYLDKMKNYDISISTISSPKKQIIGSYSYFSKTEKSKEILAVIRRYILENIYNNNIPNLDQKAIEYALEYFKSNKIDIKIYEFNTKKINTSLATRDINIHVSQNRFKKILEDQYK